MDSLYHNELQEVLSHEAIVRALFEKYESLYAVDIETSAYQCYHESDSYSSLCIEDSGDDFFGELRRNLPRTIYWEDQDYVLAKLSKEAMLKGMDEEKYYCIIYRLMIDGEPLFHKMRATKDIVNGRPHFLIGVRNVDAAYRRDLSRAREISAMQKKEINHLEAILASAEGYLEVNLTKDLILGISPRHFSDDLSAELDASTRGDQISYSAFEKQRIDHQVVENLRKYREISNREYLMDCFEQGERRASVTFSMLTPDGKIQPCKKMFYLYRDDHSGDILAFCVLHDLTEHQRREKELKDLEQQLQMSRIRNFTSQMQPHFLYNALGSIQEVVLDDPQYASELIGDFTVHLRSCIRAMANDDPILFEQELDNVRAYVNIEKMRFGDKLKVIYDIDDDHFSILPLSVQPLVENAIRHGIYQRGEKGGIVAVRTKERDDAYVISVEDNGVGFDTAILRDDSRNKQSNSTGLKNITFRLEKVMGAKVEIESTLNIGTTVTIILPKEKKENESDYCR